MIYFMGDVHSYIPNIINRLKQIENPSDKDYIIVLGDLGAEYGKLENKQLKKVMRDKFPGKWIILRGNHDARYWSRHTHWVENEFGDLFFDIEKGWSVISNPYQHNYLVEDEYPNIWYVQDEGGFYKIDNMIFLMIPGAYSVDKTHRIIQNLPYEPEEMLTKDEMRRLNYYAEVMRDRIDFVCSHTGPLEIEWYLWDLFLNGVRQDKVDKTMEEWMNSIYSVVKNGKNFKQWFFGHFHGDKVCGSDFTLLNNQVVSAEQYGKETAWH